MMNKIDQDTTLFINYLEVLKGRVFKILPLLEEDNVGVEKYIASLLFELNGLKNVILKLDNNHHYITLLATLEEIYSETVLKDYDISCLRSEILKSINVVNKLQKGE